MSEIINFNEIKNKATDKDLDKFEQYVYGLYDSMATGKLSITDIMTKIKDYMEKNNVSEEKFINIQKKMMDKYADMYGVDFKDIESQMKSMGVDPKSMGINMENLNYESFRKTLSFHDKYNIKTQMKKLSLYKIKNNINDLDIEMNEEEVTLKSSKKIDLNDSELNEFLCSYKKLFKEKPLNIRVCENTSSYDY